jgi:uncharacterized protein GlcG (DUF336 family)
MKNFTKAILFTTATCISGSALAEDEEGLATFKAMKPDVAIKLAQATLKVCRDGGYQIAVAVVDRAGVVQVILRDQLAGAHTPDTARRKAWTAASFKTDTIAMMEETQAGKPQSGVRFVTDAMMIGGGIPVEVAGSVIGAIGVSGAPGGEIDHMCAEKGIEAVEDILVF